MPDDSITQVQLALSLVRIAGSVLADPVPAYDPGFTDVPDYARAEVSKAKYNGLLDGTSPTTFDPWSNATRGQVCEMLSRPIAKLPAPTCRGLYFLGFNVSCVPFDDPVVRKALALAVDREAIVNMVSASWSPDSPLPVPATGVVPPGMPGFSLITQDFLSSTAQVDEVLDLPDDAGYPGGAGLPEIVIRVPDTPLHRQVAEAVVEHWAAIGVEASVEALSWAEYYAVLGDESTMLFRMAWQADYGDAYNMLDIFRSDSEYNLTRWGSDTYDELLDESLGPMTPQQRIEIYAQLETILSVDEMPIIPIYWF